MSKPKPSSLLRKPTVQQDGDTTIITFSNGLKLAISPHVGVERLVFYVPGVGPHCTVPCKIRNFIAAEIAAERLNHANVPPVPRRSVPDGDLPEQG